MKDSTQRAFICLDEWLGIFLLAYLFETGSKLFWYVAIPWAIAVYGISYPFHWWGQEDAGQKTLLHPLHRRRRRERPLAKGTPRPTPAPLTDRGPILRP